VLGCQKGSGADEITVPVFIIFHHPRQFWL